VPIDPSIPLSVKAPELPSPLEVYSTVSQIQAQREAAELRREAAEEARQRRVDAQEERAEKKAEQSQLDQLYASSVTTDPETGHVTLDYDKLLAGAPGHLVPTLRQQFAKDVEAQNTLIESSFKLDKSRREWLGAEAQDVLAAQGDPELWRTVVLRAEHAKAITKDTAEQLRRVTDPKDILARAQAWQQAAGGTKPTLMNVPSGGVIFDPVTRQPIYTNERPATATAGFTLSPGSTRYGPTGEVIASVPAAPGGGAGFTLSPGATRYGPNGEVIASRPPAPSTPQTRPVTSGDAGRIADLDTSRDDLAILSTAITQAGATGTAAKVGASMPAWVTDVTGWGTSAKQKQALIDRVKQVIGKALEGGVLRKEDEVKYEKILPTIADPPAIVISKLKGLDAALLARRQTQLDALADAGYDTSRFQARPTRPLIGEDDPLTVKAPNGTTYTFKSAAEAAAFKKRAGIQ